MNNGDAPCELGKVLASAYNTEAVEILTALKKLGGELSAVRRANGAVYSHTFSPLNSRLFHWW